MIRFQPILIEDKALLDTIPIIDGQYIVIMNVPEIYIDMDSNRKKISGSLLNIAKDAPNYPSDGDIWLVTN